MSCVTSSFFHSFSFVPIHSCYSFAFSVHSLVSDSSAHVSRLLSVLWVPYISCVLVLDHSGLIPMCYCFTIPAVHPSYPFHMELHLLSHVVCFHAPDLWALSFHMYLLPFTSGSLLLFRQLCLLSTLWILWPVHRPGVKPGQRACHQGSSTWWLPAQAMVPEPAPQVPWAGGHRSPERVPQGPETCFFALLQVQGTGYQS